MNKENKQIKTKYRLADFVTHPIQYQVPLLKALSGREEIELKVFFVEIFQWLLK